jgi:hypothetical protein
MRLADGDPPVLAAALADASPDRLERLLAENAGFNELVHACRALLDLPDDAWLERMRHLVRERRVLAEVEAARQGRPPAMSKAARPSLVLVASNPEPQAPSGNEA